MNLKMNRSFMNDLVAHVITTLIQVDGQKNLLFEPEIYRQ